MPFGILFILLLMLVGGVAAYWGDRVGMLVGRRRLSVFGLRPKHTSQVIAIATGVLIVLFTLSTLLVISNTVRQALFGMDELQNKVVVLSAEVTAIERERVDLEERNELLRKRAEQLELETRELEREAAELRSERATLQSEVETLKSQVSAAQAEIEIAREQLEELQANLDFFRMLGEEVFNVALDLYEADFAVRAGTVLDRFLVDVTGGPEGILANLRSALAQTEQKLLDLGLGDPRTGVALRLDRYVQFEGETIQISEEQVLQQVLLALLQAAPLGFDAVIVEVSAVTNARPSEFVYADFTALVPNRIVFHEGEVIRERTFDSGASKAEIFDEFMRFARVELSGVARSELLPTSGFYGEITYAQAYEAVDEIARREGKVIVRAVAARDIWVDGALDLRFEFGAAG